MPWKNPIEQDEGRDWWYIGLMTLIIGGLSFAMILLAYILTMCAIDPTLIPKF